MNARRESKERNLTWRIQEDNNFWSTSWSPFHAYYMSFRSSGSQKSNTLNGAQIRAELKKLWPLEANRTKLKANFVAAKSAFGCEITRWSLRNQPLVAKWRPSACEISQPILHAYEILLSASRYLWPTLLYLFFRYLLFKSSFSPCNPPMIGFLS